jgi:mono/diheme cytochrome c family protein
MFGHEGAVLDEPRLLSAKGGIATAVSISASLRTGMATGSMPSDTAAASNEARKGVNGEAAGGTCLGCHGYDAKGSPQAPALDTGKWLDSDGSLSGITRTITDGVQKPKHFSVPMPARSGAPLSDSDVAAVAAYVWAVGHTVGK